MTAVAAALLVAGGVFVVLAAAARRREAFDSRSVGWLGLVIALGCAVLVMGRF